MCGGALFCSPGALSVNRLECKVEIMCKLVLSALCTQVIGLFLLVPIPHTMPPGIPGLAHSLTHACIHSFIQYSIGPSAGNAEMNKTQRRQGSFGIRHRSCVRQRCPFLVCDLSKLLHVSETGFPHLHIRHWPPTKCHLRPVPNEQQVQCTTSAGKSQHSLCVQAPQIRSVCARVCS